MQRPPWFAKLSLCALFACAVPLWSNLAAAQPNADQPAGQPAKPGAVSGTVTDPAGEPVAGATVVLVDTKLAAFSEADGTYVIDSVPPGDYQVQVTAPAGATSAATVAVTAGATARLDVKVETDEFVGETIIVTGTRSPEKIFDAPLTVEAVTATDLEQSGGVNFLQALSDVKGVDFANSGLGDQRISARGFNTQFNSRMIAMIDGRLAQLPGNGLPQNNLLPTSTLDVKAIEVVVGPASALYGANAHSGVINVITKSPWDQSGAAVTVRGGQQGLIDAAARVAGTYRDKLGWKINAQYLRAEDFMPAADSHCYADGDLCEQDLLHDYNISSVRTDGSLYYKFGDWFAKASAGFSENDGFALTNNGRNHIRDWQVQYQALQLTGRDVYFQFTRTTTDAGGSYQLSALDAAAEAMLADDPTISREQLPGLLDATRDAIRFVDTSQMMDSEVQYRRAIGGLQTTWGGQWRLYLPSSNGTYLDDVGKDISVAELGGYAQLDYAELANKRLRLLGAVRFDNHTIFGAQISPKASAVYSATPDHKLRLGYNRAFKSPTILENYLLLSDFLLGNRTGFVIRDGAGNELRSIPGLTPERVHAFEFGYKGVFRRSLFIDAVAHTSLYDDFIGPLTRQTDPADPDNPTFAYYPDGRPVAAGTPVEGTLFTYTNFGRAQVSGVDVGAKVYPINGITLSGSVSWITLNSDETEAPAFNTPNLKLKGSVTVADLGVRNYFLRADARYQSEYEFASGVWVGTVPASLFVDATLGYKLPRYGLSISAHVQNALGNENVEILGAPISQRLVFVQLGYTRDGFTR